MIADVSYSLSTAPGVWRRIIQNVPNVSCNADNSGFLNLSAMTGTLRTTSEKKSKKRDFGPISLDPYPPTINRDILIWATSIDKIDEVRLSDEIGGGGV